MEVQVLSAAPKKEIKKALALILLTWYINKVAKNKQHTLSARSSIG
ncbi:hypothetical protein [Bacillus multifaciens]|nr:hypothetical protein [Bacillus sp. WLY-B-L8]MDP7979855.1 hypothetical protein [Bacillus sp. WLY-B-L8]